MNEDTTTDAAIERAISIAWHEFRYPRPATDEPTEAFRRAIRALASEGLLAPAGSVRTTAKEFVEEATRVSRLTVATELRRLADEFDATRAEWRETDNRTLRSSGLGHAVTRLRARTLELEAHQ